MEQIRSSSFGSHLKDLLATAKEHKSAIVRGLLDFVVGEVSYLRGEEIFNESAPSYGLYQMGSRLVPGPGFSWHTNSIDQEITSHFEKMEKALEKLHFNVSYHDLPSSLYAGISVCAAVI